MSRRIKGTSRQVRLARIGVLDSPADNIGASNVVSTLLPQKRRLAEEKAARERVKLMLSGMFLPSSI